MPKHNNPSTRGSLLNRLRNAPQDSEDWRVFVRQYSPSIHAWCRRRGVRNEQDIEDVTQIVLLKFHGRVKTFEYDPNQSFRAWLKTVTIHAWSDFMDSRKFSRLAGSDEAAAALGSLEARDSLAESIEREHARAILEEAMTRVQLCVDKPYQWAIFKELAIEGRPRQEVAERYQMSVDAVRMVKNRVRKMVREEIQRLEGL